ncbi:zf-rbx1 domain-containing protein [Rhizoctonia solani AG-1 IA]|uniref:Zf-rbx1 domain-containing protein n=1 Tax=Thanatephorus cucumeris (strain AG1-IA) TaxID=983506 RepID=L8WY36_THACA|nr:zf-rbx1 domain-containing protein [Rhizoctonia solani AG-1 IA]
MRYDMVGQNVTHGSHSTTTPAECCRLLRTGRRRPLRSHLVMSTHAPENIRLPTPTASEHEPVSGENGSNLVSQQTNPNTNAGPTEATTTTPTPGQIALDPVVIDAIRSLSNEAPARQSHQRRSSNASSTSSDIPLPPPRQPRQPARPPISTRIRRALGLATPKASLAWRLGFGTSELIVIAVLLGLSSRPDSVPPDGRPLVDGGFGMSQWQACDRPLGAWNIVWAVKAFLGLGMAWWEYVRAVRPSTDQLLAVERARLSREVRRARRNNLNSGRMRSAPNSPTGCCFSRSFGDATMSGSPRSIEIVQGMRRIRERREHEERWYSRPLWIGLVCYRQYTPIWVNRLMSIHFSLYLVTINIILVCMGRNPIRPGGRMGHINPDIPKMPRTMVERIPLVMYIPTATATTEPTEPTAPEPAHVYPPATSVPTTPTAPKRRFFFLKKKPKKSNTDQSKNQPDDVEAAEWEKNEYPFVKLEANRAACAICLTDFEPPRRVGEDGESAAEPLRLLACGHVFHVSSTALKECLDPWLVDVSGRCPTCQRPVEEGDLNPEEGAKKKKRRWGRGWPTALSGSSDNPATASELFATAIEYLVRNNYNETQNNLESEYYLQWLIARFPSVNNPGVRKIKIDRRLMGHEYGILRCQQDAPQVRQNPNEWSVLAVTNPSVVVDLPVKATILLKIIDIGELDRKGLIYMPPEGGPRDEPFPRKENETDEAASLWPRSGPSTAHPTYVLHRHIYESFNAQPYAALYRITQ